MTDELRLSYSRYLKGDGVEIGALNRPMPLPPGARALYADSMTPAEVEKHFPGSRVPDIVLDGEFFTNTADNSFDFVVANHVLEHVTSPIGTLTEWWRILRARGILFMAIPDKRFTFDAARKRTPLAHLIADAESSVAPKYRNFPHLVEWATHVEKLPVNSEAWRTWIDGQFNAGYAVHNHVWILEDILALIKHLWKVGIPYQLVHYVNTLPGDHEFLVLVRKLSPSPTRHLGKRAYLEGAYRLEQLPRLRRLMARLRVPGMVLPSLFNVIE